MRDTINRRDFIKISTLAGAGLLLGIYLPGCQDAALVTEVTATPEPSQWFEPNAYLRIDNNGLITIMVPRSEMGQGVQTALPMIVAEELEADWRKVRVEQAPADPIYGSQVTGGSRSIQDSYLALRIAGATARELLITAAAQIWHVEPANCSAEQGAVVDRESNRRLSYGELVEIAAALPVPKTAQVSLKEPKDFRLIGTRIGQIDNPHFVDGSAIFGSDVRLPGMLYATVVRCPVFGGKVAGFDPAKAKAVGGVKEVVEISTGVAVVAESTWAAIQGREALEVAWDEGANANLDSAAIRQLLADQLQAQQTATDSQTGPIIEAIYEAPYLAHATMEPMSCVADVGSDRCEVWGPTQDRQQALVQIRSITRLPKEAITLHVPLIGCGLGRRLRVDYVDEAVQISKAVGAPVKLFWSREDDIQHDFYRPASYHWLRAEMDAQGWPVAWQHHIASQAIGSSSDITQGAASLPYRFSVSARGYTAPLTIPTGYWRSVFNTQNAFVNESFLDEIAATAGQDPYEFRLALVDDPAMKAVLELAATKAGWGSPLPDGWGRGIACHTTWGVTHVAQVAEVSIEEGAVRVHRVVCAIDCGLVINPDMVEAQMESGIAVGLTAALKGEITLKKGRVEQENFHNYAILGINEMPTIEVYIASSDRAPQGVGEMGNPPVIPAVTNAVFAITGKRIRRLPIRPEDLRNV